MNTSIIKGKIKTATAENERLARADATGRPGEEFKNAEMLQPYGIASNPPVGAECLMLRSDQNITIIMADDKRYRLSLKSGEVAVYDNNDNVIHLQEDGKISIKSNAEVTVISKKVTVNADSVELGNGGTGVLTEASIIPCPYTPSVPHTLRGLGSKTIKASQ